MLCTCIYIWVHPLRSPPTRISVIKLFVSETTQTLKDAPHISSKDYTLPSTFLLPSSTLWLLVETIPHSFSIIWHALNYPPNTSTHTTNSIYEQSMTPCVYNFLLLFSHNELCVSLCVVYDGGNILIPFTRCTERIVHPNEMKYYAPLLRWWCISIRLLVGKQMFPGREHEKPLTEWCTQYKS